MTRNPLYTSPTNSNILMQGRSVNPLDPDSFEPKLEEIIHALSNICRFNGHTSRFYSVAEHSLNCALIGHDLYYITTPHCSLYLLLHDGAEAYLQDLIRPLKQFATDEMLLAEKKITEKIMQLIPCSDKDREDFKHPLFQEMMDEIDTRMAVTEVDTLIPHCKGMLPGYKPYALEIPAVVSLNVKIVFEITIKSLMAELTQETK